jgi:hypothetical protein
LLVPAALLAVSTTPSLATEWRVIYELTATKELVCDVATLPFPNPTAAYEYIKEREKDPKIEEIDRIEEIGSSYVFVSYIKERVGQWGWRFFRTKEACEKFAEHLRRERSSLDKYRQQRF